MANNEPDKFNSLTQLSGQKSEEVSMQFYKNVDQLFEDYYKSFPRQNITTSAFWFKILSLGLWRRRPLEERFQESVQYQLQSMQQLRAFAQSPENREALKELVFALELSIISVNWWQQSQVAKTHAFTTIAKAVLDEKLDG